MEPMRNRLRRLFGNEKGATVVEYAVILALIIAGMIVIIWSLGTQIQQGVENFNEAFEDARTPGSSGDGGQPGGTPPGQGGTPPGQGGTPPGQGGTPPGQGKK